MTDELQPTNENSTADQYQCWSCGGTFNKGWSDKEAIEELHNRMPGLNLDECAVVCDDCYNEMMIFEEATPGESPTNAISDCKDLALATKTIVALAEEVGRLRAAIVGAKIALARDESISAAMRILVAAVTQDG